MALSGYSLPQYEQVFINNVVMVCDATAEVNPSSGIVPVMAYSFAEDVAPTELGNFLQSRDYKHAAPPALKVNPGLRNSVLADGEESRTTNCQRTRNIPPSTLVPRPSSLQKPINIPPASDFGAARRRDWRGYFSNLYISVLRSPGCPRFAFPVRLRGATARLGWAISTAGICLELPSPTCQWYEVPGGCG